MLGGDGRSLGHCGSDIVCDGFSWNDRGGGGRWRKIYIPHHILIHFLPFELHLIRKYLPHHILIHFPPFELHLIRKYLPHILIRASVDPLYRDGTGQISRDPRTKPHQTRRIGLAKPSKLTRSHSPAHI